VNAKITQLVVDEEEVIARSRLEFVRPGYVTLYSILWQVGKRCIGYPPPLSEFFGNDGNRHLSETHVSLQ